MANNNEQRRSRRKKKTHKAYAAVTLFLSVVVVILCFLIMFYTANVEIKGNDYCTDQEIYNAVLENPYEINTLYVLAKYELGFGKKLACMDEMKVSLKNPWTLKVTVKEKSIMGYVKTNDQYAYFDKDGLVVDISDELKDGLPCIDGVEFKKIQLYKKLKCSKTKIFNQILTATQEVKKYELSPDKLIYEENSLMLYFGDVCVSLGSSVSSEQMAQIEPILKKLTDQKGTLHLENYSASTKVITFEKASEATTDDSSESTTDESTADATSTDSTSTDSTSTDTTSTDVYTWDGSDMNLYDGTGWYDSDGNYYDSSTYGDYSSYDTSGTYGGSTTYDVGSVGDATGNYGY